MKKYLIFLFCLNFHLNTECFSQSKNKNSIEGFDISKDDSEILFSFNKNNHISIYKLSLKEKTIKKIVESKEGKNYTNPKFTKDGKQFLFIESDINNVNRSMLCLSNLDGTILKRLTDGRGIITEAIFSANQDEILFCKANEYSQNSSIGIKTAHDFDIYSINILSNKISKITNLKSYSINHISFDEMGNILFRLEQGENSGIFTFNRITGKMKPFILKNNPREDKTLYYTPLSFIKYNTIIFTAPYEMYKMDINTRKANLLYDSKGTHNIRGLSTFNNSPTLAFTKQSELYFYILDLDGKNLKKILLEISQ